MLFNSIEFLLFFPAVTLAYYLIPGRLRMYWLLVVSYVFYMGWNPKYALLLLASTAITFASGLLIGKAKEKQDIRLAKFWVGASFTVNLAILFFYKYFGFVLGNINALLEWTGRKSWDPGFDVLLPVGISFYIFQALSYTMDVYRGDVRVEHNFFKYAVFVSFFPQLVAGPIERSSHLLTQFDTPHAFRWENVRDGLQLMIWGFFQKIVIADRVAILVDQVFNYPTYYTAIESLIASVLFAVQIYGDFGGYSNIAIGAAQVMGFDLMQNFRRPYFATSVQDFWRRWHISLSTWFRDYLYIPLGGSRKGKKRRYINLMIVFLTSGLWHGANWTYLIWGGLNGAFQVVGDFLRPARKKLMERLGVQNQTESHKLLQGLMTFVMVDFAWIFFRADDLAGAMQILHNLTVWDFTVLFDQSLLHLGFSSTEWLVLLIALAIHLAVSVAQECGIRLRQTINRQQLWFRWVCCMAGLMYVLVFGIYGPGFDAAAFIYFQF